VQDAIKAREDKERAALVAQSYANDVIPKARGEAAKRRQDAEAYKAEVIANAEGEADRFSRILGAYQKAPRVTRERIYLQTLEQILSNSTKVLVDTDGGNMIYLPLDRLIEQRANASGTAKQPAAPTPAPSAPTSRTSRERTVR
jgi:membrane protease subunit HflK